MQHPPYLFALFQQASGIFAIQISEVACDQQLSFKFVQGPSGMAQEHLAP
jgi:hypothetical protein